MEDYRARRLAHNEAVARRMNEALEKLSPGERSSPEWFICECSRLECTDYIIEITPRDYERIHEHARRFIVRPGHEKSENTLDSLCSRRSAPVVEARRLPASSCIARNRF